MNHPWDRDSVDDRRVRRTRKAVFDAFMGLVLERRYDDIRVSDILIRADIGRSTFYQHFDNKDDVLLRSLSGLFSVLADAVTEVDGEVDRLGFVLEHFWANRHLAKGLLDGPSSPRVRDLLADLLVTRLEQARERRGAAPRLPIPLAAQGLAHAQLGLIRSWLEGRARCPTAALAEGFERMSRAMAAAAL